MAVAQLSVEEEVGTAFRKKLLQFSIMLRRNIRLRREYLYRKSLEGKERLLYEKKRKIKEALEGKDSNFFFFFF